MSIVEDNYYLKKSKLIELQEIINNGQADGKVNNRIMNNLNSLYMEFNK